MRSLTASVVDEMHECTSQVNLLSWEAGGARTERPGSGWRRGRLLRRRLCRLRLRSRVGQGIGTTRSLSIRTPLPPRPLLAANVATRRNFRPIRRSCPWWRTLAAKWGRVRRRLRLISCSRRPWERRKMGACRGAVWQRR